MTLTESQAGYWPSPLAPYSHRVRMMANGYNPRYKPEDWNSRAGCFLSLPHETAYFTPADVEWIRRESRRQRRAPVPSLPMGLEDRYPEHCVYLSAVDGMIGYTPDYLYGRQDRQVRMKPGKYLAKYYPEIPAHVAAEWVHACAPKTLTISSDADVIADVYFTGPHSCQHPESDHANDYTRDWNNHPARMYAGPDLAIAYLGDRKGAIARSIVWPEKMLYVRVYGEMSLADRLEALGYRQGDVNGARCRLRKDGDRVIVPYVDGANRGTVDGEFLVLGQRGEYDLAVTCGYVGEEEERFYCRREDCDNECDEGDAYCSSCEDAHWSCDDCGGDYFSDCDRPNGEAGHWCDDCYVEHVTTCEACSDTFEEDALPYRVRTARDGWMLAYCPDCAEDRHECETCGDVCENDSPCCPTDDDSNDDTTDSTPDSPPDTTTADAGVPDAVLLDTFTRGQAVVFVAGGYAAEPGQIGYVTALADGYAQIAWDRRSGTMQNDGGYLTRIRPATVDDIAAYEARYGGTR